MAMTETVGDLIDYLLKREFGSLAPPVGRTIDSIRSTQTRSHVLAEERQQKISAAKARYMAMNLDQLQDRANAAREEDAKAAKLKAQQEELALFCNQPRARADFAHWSKMATWTLEDAIALSLGRNPDLVSWDKLNGSGERFVQSALLHSTLRAEYAQRRSLVSRAVTAGELPIVKYDDRDGWRSDTKPEQFLTWALATFDEIPSELVEKVRARCKHVHDMQSSTAKPDEQLAATLLRHQKDRRQGGIARWDGHPKTKAKALAHAFWEEWRAGKHPKLKTTEQFATEVLHKWPCLTSAKVVCSWSAQWNKEARAKEPPAS